MKKLATISLLALFATRLVSQTDTSAINLWSIYPGYIITWEDDTIHGFIKLNNLVHNQKKAIFYNKADDSDPAEKYKPKDIKGYKVGPREYDSYKYHVTNETKGYHFFLKLIDGPLSMYKWYFEPENRQKERVDLDEEDILNSKIDLSFSEDDLSSNTFVKKYDAEFIGMSSMKFITNFKKNMSAYVADFPELAERIANKEEGYRSSDIEKIIREYNDWYLKSHKNSQS
ncbi:MAG: hypothetical protein R2750_14075, partial [Bacteroidales bacterium]